MSELHGLGLAALDERESAETEGGYPRLPTFPPICQIPPYPIPLPIPVRPLFDVSSSG